MDNPETGAAAASSGKSSIEQLRADYRTLNKSFAQRYVVRFGRGVGFGAEFVGLVKIMFSCLNGGIGINLEATGDAKGIAVERGWTDYFDPLFPEVSGVLLPLLNRPQFPLQGAFPLVRTLASWALRATSPGRFFMFDGIRTLPPQLRVDELAIDLDYWAACQLLASIAWSPKLPVAQQIELRIASLGLPRDYIALHVRRGDKTAESSYTPLKSYVAAVERLGRNSPAVYVATDDSSVLEELRSLIGRRLEVVSLASASAKGHYEGAFNSLSPSQRRDRVELLLVELEILARSDFFIGSSPSNVFYLTRMRRANERLIDVREN